MSDKVHECDDPCPESREINADLVLKVLAVGRWAATSRAEVGTRVAFERLRK